jgi:transglutaminase-like putative cysteine protease
MMIRRSFWRFLKRQRKTKAAGLIVPALASLAILFSNPAYAGDSAPDWLRAAAQEKLPDYPKETKAVVVYDDEEIVIKPNGEVEFHGRRAYRLLRPEARKVYGREQIYFDNETKISSLKAWTITAQGQTLEVKEKDDAEMSVSSYEIFSDIRAKVVTYPAAEPGNTVGFEVVRKQRPFVFDDVWEFQDIIPVRSSRFSLEMPVGWEYTALWAHSPEIKPQTNGSNQFVWEVHDMPAVEVEPEMPPLEALAARMYVKYYPRDPAMRAKTVGTWKDMGLWFNGLANPSRESTPAISQQVAQLTTGAPDTLGKMKAIASFTQHQIRYAAIEIGIGGFQPHAAGDTFTHRYGDCKDKATLMSAMLKDIGIDSYLVLIDTVRGAVQPDFPGNYFNHAILAIKIPDTVPDATSSPRLRMQS